MNFNQYTKQAKSRVITKSIPSLPYKTPETALKPLHMFTKQ